MLTHHRWALPVLAEIDRTQGSRFVTLSRKLDIASDSLRRTLAALEVDGLVERNPGHGHPLRPEYLLTERGVIAARVAASVLASLPGDQDIVLKKWSLPVLARLQEPQRFSELRTALPGATARALTLALKDLQAAGLVRRRVSHGYPPAVAYEATRRGARVVPLARGLPV
jgi:DNA-binding HxlR family transcriptional regulator